VRVTRRHFLYATGAAAGGTVGTGFYTWKIEPHWLEIVRRPLPVRALPSALAGKTLAQISDVHVGPRVDDDYVLSVFARVAALRPDIVALTGDLVSHHERMFEQMEGVYRHFPKGRIATVGIPGNHDYGWAWSHPETAERVVTIAQEHGIVMLRNQIHEVEGLQIVGFDDLWGNRFEPNLALEGLDNRRAAIALSHNPDTVDLPVWERYQGWILSGHTHGGQCKAPFLPPPLLPVRNRLYTQGEFRLSGNRMLYINRGVGHLLPVRINVRPEVTLFELRSV
jgi:predicted MPP superfamily phosphohydrolase